MSWTGAVTVWGLCGFTECMSTLVARARAGVVGLWRPLAGLTDAHASTALQLADTALSLVVHVQPKLPVMS